MKKKGIVLLSVALLSINMSVFAEDVNLIDVVEIANRNVGVRSMYEVEPNNTPVRRNVI